MRLPVAVAVAAFPVASYGEPFTGNFIYSICTSSDPAQQGACLGFYSGLVEGMIFGTLNSFAAVGLGAEMTLEDMQNFGNGILGYCLPPSANNQQIVDINVQYLRDNPSLRHESARSSYLLAMQQAFPCPME